MNAHRARQRLPVRAEVGGVGAVETVEKQRGIEPVGVEVVEGGSCRTADADLAGAAECRVGRSPYQRAIEEELEAAAENLEAQDAGA